MLLGRLRRSRSRPIPSLRSHVRRQLLRHMRTQRPLLRPALQLLAERRIRRLRRLVTRVPEYTDDKEYAAAK